MWNDQIELRKNYVIEKKGWKKNSKSIVINWLD